MKSFFYLLTLPFLAALPPRQTTRAMAPSGYEARLETRMDGDRLTVIGHCRNVSPQPVVLRYELRTDKRGLSGTSSNAQSGEVTVASQQDVPLSQSTINVAPTDYYRIKLRMLNAQGAVVAEDSVVHHAARP